MRSVWIYLQDVVLELQPFAWRFHNTSVEQGLQTLEDFVRANDYVAVTLPRPSKSQMSGPALLDWCSLRPNDAAVADPRVSGFEMATALEWRGFASLVSKTLQNRHFHEVLLTRRSALQRRRRRMNCPE